MRVSKEVEPIGAAIPMSEFASRMIHVNDELRDYVDLVDAYDEYPLQPAHITRVFTPESEFNCPSLKPILVSATSGANLLPEDISIVAAMGDGLSAGSRLWSNSDVEVRGAAFTAGGDANLRLVPTFASKCSLARAERSKAAGK